MRRISGSNYVVQDGKRKFTDGTPGTTINAEWLNSVQEEILSVIEANGLSESADNAQLSTIIKPLNVVHVRYSYDNDLSEAIEDNAGALCSFLIDGPAFLSDSPILSAGNSLWFLSPSGTLDFRNHSLEMKGTILAHGLHQIFIYSGTGRLTGKSIVDIIHPEWWGVDGTADGVQIQEAFDCVVRCGGGTVSFANRTYNVGTTVTLPSGANNINVVGNGSTISGDGSAGSVVHFGDNLARIDNLFVQGITFTTSAARTSVLTFSYCANMKMISCRINGTASFGVILDGGNWQGSIDTCNLRGTFTHIIYTQADSVNSYKSNGFTVQNSWLNGMSNPVGISGIYLSDVVHRFRSVNNYFEAINTAGSHAINVHAAYKFLSSGDHFENIDSVGIQTTNTGTWEHVNFGSSVVNGIDVAGNGCHIHICWPATEPTNNYVDISGSNNKVLIPSYSKYSDSGSDNRIDHSNGESWLTVSGDNRARGDLSHHFGWMNKRELVPNGITYDIPVTACGKTLSSGALTTSAIWNLPELTSSLVGWWVAIYVADSTYQVVLQPFTGNKFGALPDAGGGPQFVCLRSTYRMVIIEAVSAAIWVVRSGTVVIPLSTNTSLLRGMLSDHYIYTNQNAVGTITVMLPDAEDEGEDRAALFLRTANHAFHIDPQAGDQIRGGSGAGKYLSLDAIGTGVKLRNVIAGWWEPEYSYGTLSNE